MVHCKKWLVSRLVTAVVSNLASNLASDMDTNHWLVTSLVTRLVVLQCVQVVCVGRGHRASRAVRWVRYIGRLRRMILGTSRWRDGAVLYACNVKT